MSLCSFKQMLFLVFLKKVYRVSNSTQKLCQFDNFLTSQSVAHGMEEINEHQQTFIHH